MIRSSLSSSLDITARRGTAMNRIGGTLVLLYHRVTR